MNKNIAFNGKVLTMRSENGPLNCIIDCEGSGRGFYLNWESAGSVIEGFTIANGSSTGNGGAISSDAMVTISNCRIIGNSAANYGGGIFLGSSTAGSIIINCLISANSVSETSGNGGGIFLTTYFHPAFPVTITHSTVINNRAYWGGGLGHQNFQAFTLNMEVSNAIFWGNSATYGPQLAVLDWYLGDLQYSNIEGGEANIRGTPPWGDGNITSPPLFVDTTAGDPVAWDVSLQPDSPCIDSGTNEILEILGADLEGNERIWDGDDNGEAITDMGAFEYGAPLKGDFDNDGDIDGYDLAGIAEDPDLIRLNQFAMRFGKLYLY